MVTGDSADERVGAAAVDHLLDRPGRRRWRRDGVFVEQQVGVAYNLGNFLITDECDRSVFGIFLPM
ncbi:hypothetical protein [Nocardia abscessus]|uniref:hypothetical protein n=1 Tax=Nocardia abscessus TaxID=120957 RepID=UPI00245556DA|nr:hypothetical protein [Nocardia abscessus]